MYKVVLTHSELGSITLQDNSGDNIVPLNLQSGEFQNAYKRSEQFYGVLRSFGDSLQFALNGALYVQRVFDADGAGAEVTVEMYYSDGGVDFSQFYSGKLDLKTYLKERTGEYNPLISVNVVNGDFEDRIISNLDTEYDVSGVAEAGVGDNYIDVLFRKRNSFIQGELSSNYDVDNPAVNLIMPSGSENFVFARATKDTGDERINSIVSDFVSDEFGTATQPFNIFQAEANCNITLSYSTTFFSIVTSNITFQLRLIKTTQYDDYISGIDIATTPYTGAGNYTLSVTNHTDTLNNGEKLYLCVKVTASGNVLFSNTEIDINITEAQPDSTHKAINQKKIFTELVRLATGEDNRVDSQILDNVDDVLTTGELLRITTSAEMADIDPRVITSMSEAFQSVNVPRCLGMGIDSSGFNKRLIVDHRSEFYKPELIENIGQVIDFSEEFAQDLVYNQVSLEYPDFENEVVNGRYEFNTGSVWNTPTDWIKNKLQNKSDWRADGAGIEEARRTPFAESESTDTKYDNEKFMVACFDNAGTITTRRDEFIDSYLGLPDNSFCYNLPYYPPYAMKYWGWWMLAGLQYNLADFARNYITRRGNNITITDTNADSEAVEVRNSYEFWNFAKYLEQAKVGNIFTNSYNALFEPIYYNFTAPVTYQFLNKFETNRHGVIKFEYQDSEYYGYAMQVPAVPGVSSEWKLLKISKYALSLLS